MSFFYLSPVKGELPLHLLEVILKNRLDYLKAIHNEETVVYDEYMTEGSVYDNVGHFMLCIVIILSENIEISQFFTKTECLLFKHRISALTSYEIRCFSKKLLRTIKKYDNMQTSVCPLQVLCQHLMLKDVAHHICSTCNNKCTVHSFKLKFTQCLPLVAKRQVELENGLANVPCGGWKQLLLTLFSENIRNRIINTDLDSIKGDPRLMAMVNKIKTDFPMVRNKINNILLSNDVDAISINFPPCMLNLHRCLRKNHRLSHSQRFYYSLFLKDIGMPIEEAISFWRSEYKLNPNGHHNCSHSWKEDEKKYLYSIRHMYGLEGCRKNYTSVNCRRIQRSSNACSEGGCPFKSFDTSKMIPLLKNKTEIIMSQIDELRNKHSYTSACMVVLETSCLKLNECNSSFNFSPVKFFFTARNKDSCGV